MVDVIPRSVKKHARGKEFISKSRSLPSLQLTPDGSTNFTCSKCGLTSSLIPICLWCYQAADVEDEPKALKKRVSFSAKSPGLDEQQQVLSKSSIPSLKTSAPSCHLELQEVGQINKVNGSKTPPSHIVITRSRLSCNVEFQDDQLPIVNGISDSPPSRPTTRQNQDTSRKKRTQRDGDASTRLQASNTSYHDDDEVGPSLVAMATVPSVGLKNLPAERRASASLGAGSSFPSSTRSSLSSASRRLRHRSKSLFSLKPESSDPPPVPTSTLANTETNIATISTSSTTSTTATANMIHAAKALTRRFSSSALRNSPSCTPVSQVAPLPERDENDLVSDLGFTDTKSTDSNHNRTLRRRKRLGGVPDFPHASPSPLTDSSALNKRVSATTLHPPQPIAVSFKLGKRPNSPESDKSQNSGVPSPVDGVLGTIAPLPLPIGNKGKEVSRPFRDEESPLAPILLVSKPVSVDVSVTGSTTQTSMPSMSSPTESRTSSPTSGTSAVYSIPAVPASSSPTRLGHPSRPYYSAIRKHCMSSPAPVILSSRPASISQPLSAGVPATRPTSATIAQPFAVQTPSVTPFTRRPISLGAAPIAAPAISNVMGTHSHVGSVRSTATKGMSVFDLEDDVDSDVFEDDGYPNGPSSFKAKQGSRSRKSNSLSRAFGRGHRQKKRRTWSSGLFSGDNEGGAPPSSFASRVPTGTGERRASTSGVPPPLNLDRIGISMSGETELRMSLALMEQQERAQRQEQQQDGAAAQTALLNVLQAQPDQKYRFRRTMDFSQQQNDASGHATPERQGTPVVGSGSTGVLARVRKFKKSVIKGLLGSSSAGGNATTTNATI